MTIKAMVFFFLLVLILALLQAPLLALISPSPSFFASSALDCITSPTPKFVTSRVTPMIINSIKDNFFYRE